MRMVYDIVDTQELLATVRALTFGRNQLQRFLPSRTVEDIDYRIVNVSRTNRAAMVRAFDTPARVGRRPGVAEKRGSLPAISTILPLSESERIQIRRLVGQVGDLIRNNVYSDAAIGAQEVANRAELLRGEALSTGQIVIDENGVDSGVIDFGVPAANKQTVSTEWSDPTADLLEDNLLPWLEIFTDATGAAPGAIVTSTRVRSYMLRNDSLRALAGVGGTIPAILTLDGLNNTLAAYGLPPVLVYDRKVEDADGVSQRVIAENRLIMLPNPDDQRVGETQYGVTEEAVVLAEARQIAVDDAPGIVAVTLVNDEPVMTATKVTAIALPVIQQPEALLTAEVFTP